MRAAWQGLVLVAIALAPSMAAAQGSLSGQGFGYPTGQLSGAARGASGSGAEMDPNSPINPAAIARSNRFSISLLFEPESRTTSFGGASHRAQVVRFPGFSITGGVRRFVVGASVSTLLDRTWTNTYADSLLIDGEWTPVTTTAASEGAISDTRLSAAYIVGPRLQFGVAYHALLGENRARFMQAFEDSSGNLDLIQSSSVRYLGSAFSVGVVAEPVRNLILGASARRGRDLSVTIAGDPTTGEGAVPSRFGLGVTWVGFPGMLVNARYDRVAWSEMDGLASSNVSTFDTREMAVGFEALGPRIAGIPAALRLGARDRTLPFGVNGSQVSERGLTGGFGVPLGRGRAQMDFALERATRTVGSAKEKAWVIAIGFGIRP